MATSFSQMEPREQKLLLGLGGVFAVIVLLLIPIYVGQTLSSKRDENQEIRDFIEKVDESRDKIEKRRGEREALLGRYSKTMPALATFVEDSAKGADLEIAESQGRPDVPHGKKYVEHILLIKFRKVGLYELVKAFEHMERSGFPVALTRLNLKPRTAEPNSYDVELNVSQFERKGEAKRVEAKDTEKEEEEP